MKVKTKTTGFFKNKKTTGFRVDATVAEAVAIVGGATVCVGYTTVGFTKGVIKGTKYALNKIKACKDAGQDCTK